MPVRGTGPSGRSGMARVEAEAFGAFLTAFRGWVSGVWVLGFVVWGLRSGVLCFVFGFWILGFGFWGFGFWVLGLECRIEGLGFGVWGRGFRVWDLGFRVKNLGCSVRNSGFKVLYVGWGGYLRAPSRPQRARPIR